MKDCGPSEPAADTLLVGRQQRPTPAGQQTIRLGRLFATADQIQALCLARKTAEIRITNTVPMGRINIARGEVVHAQFGNQTGIEAAIALVNLTDPESEIEPDRTTDHRTITLPYPQLLLEAANRKDEIAISEVNQASAGTEPDPTSPVLWVMLGTGSIDCLVPPGLTLIGRSPQSDIVIADQTVSNRHACIQVAGSEVILRDLDSTNGTHVEGARVAEAYLAGRVRLRFGNVSAILTVPAAAGR